MLDLGVDDPRMAEAVDLADLPLPTLFGFVLKGHIRVAITAAGDIREPRLQGRLGLKNGSLTSTRLGLSYESVETDLMFTP